MLLYIEIGISVDLSSFNTLKSVHVYFCDSYVCVKARFPSVFFYPLAMLLIIELYLFIESGIT